MGEVAPCLMRSVSHPLFDSCEYKEGDPLRALTSSVSFGRFMTEPLDWERWSSFSHNRTLEDVQKHSRPGAVAEKKAFFEAHYKKIASKKAAKSPQKENKPPNSSPQINLTTNITPTRSDTHPISDETQENECIFPHMSSNRQVEQDMSSSKDACSPSTNLVLAQFVNFDDDVAISCQVEQGKGSTDNVVSSEKHPFDDDVASSSQVEQGKGSTDNVVSSEKHPFDYDVASSSQVEQGKGSTDNVVSSEKHRFDDDVGSSVQVVQEKENVFSENYVFNRSSSHVDNDKNTQMKDSKSGQTKPETSLNKNRKAPTPPIRPRKATTDATEKKRSALKSLHMSLNLASVGNKIGTLKNISKPKDRLIHQALNLKVSANRVKKSSQVPPIPENRSHLNASSVCTKKPRSSSASTTVPSSFSFRSEERAAKRKEFFQKLEDKGNSKETEKIHLQPKFKARNDNKKLRVSTALEAKPCTKKETKSTSNLQKVPPTQPCSPKLGRKPMLRVVLESCCQSPWRSSSKPKNFIEINKKKLSASMASLPTKKMHDSLALMSKKQF